MQAGHFPMIDRTQRQAAVTKDDRKALALIGASLIFYVTTLWATLVLPWWAALVAAVLNGVAIGQLFVIGHDACHLAFLSTPRANSIFGRLVYLPSLTPFSIWHLIHNVRHHGHSNVRHCDGVWEPIDLADYQSLSRPRRALYRFYRSHPGVFAYYFIDYWLRQFAWPRRAELGPLRAVYFIDVLMCWSFAFLIYGLVIGHALLAGRDLALTVIVSMLVPQLVWNVLMSVTIYLQHTHPDIPWFNSMAAWHAENGRVSTTAYVRIPRWMSLVSLEMMEHPAHHLLPSVPVYNLRALNQALPVDSYPSWTWSWVEHARVVRVCKLYDFENRRWVPFPQPGRNTAWRVKHAQ
jgi:omega-6 fatty acid desaturase (delta-12 desaturase)